MSCVLSKTHSSWFQVLFLTADKPFSCVFAYCVVLAIDSDKYVTAAAPDTGEYSVDPKRKPSGVAKKFYLSKRSKCCKKESYQ